MSKNEKKKLWKLMNPEAKPKSNFDNLIDQKEKAKQKREAKSKINAQQSIKDNRIAENSTKFTQEQKMMMRFKQSMHKNTSKYNLILDDEMQNEDNEDNIILTHGGKNVDEIEDDYQKNISEEDEDEERGI